jgi:hypothetical protein
MASMADWDPPADGCLNRELLGVSSLLADVADAEDRITDLEIGDNLAKRGDDAGDVPLRVLGHTLPDPL